MVAGDMENRTTRQNIALGLTFSGNCDDDFVLRKRPLNERAVISRAVRVFGPLELHWARRERLAKAHQRLRVDLIGFGQDTAGPCKLVHPLRLHQGKGHCGLM